MVRFFLSLFSLLAYLLVIPIPIEAKSSSKKLAAYYKLCNLAVKQENIFDHFKQHPDYLQNQEVISQAMGAKYLEYIQNNYPELRTYFEKFRENDQCGGPDIFNYGEAGAFSPVTLKNMKIIGDLQKKFGDMSTWNVVEIGAGCNGLCKIFQDYLGYATYTIVEPPECCPLTKKYVNRLQIKNVQVIPNDQISQLSSYDLVISQYAFTQMDKASQQEHIEKVLNLSSNGYIILNSSNLSSQTNSLANEKILAQLYKKGRRGSLDRECPFLDSLREILIWKANDNTSLLSPPIPKLVPSKDMQKKSAVTYGFSGGRFGDCLLSYLHAKWISYKYGMFLLYRPFPYSDQLMLDDDSARLDQFSFEHKKVIKNENDFIQIENSTLYEIPYFPFSQFEVQMHNYYWLPYFEVDWQDAGFRKEIKSLLAPKNHIPTLPLPKDRLTVCVHIRRGGNVDHPDTCYKMPLKFPPDSYYIKQIERIANIFPTKKLYVFLMTDDLDPAALAKKYSAAINNKNMDWDYRSKGNSPHQNVLEDFYSIGKFDCLIRCESNFSLMGSLLGDYKILITPKHAYVKNKKIVVDQVELEFNSKNL